MIDILLGAVMDMEVDCDLNSITDIIAAAVSASWLSELPSFEDIYFVADVLFVSVPPLHSYGADLRKSC